MALNQTTWTSWRASGTVVPRSKQKNLVPFLCLEDNYYVKCWRNNGSSCETDTQLHSVFHNRGDKYAGYFDPDFGSICVRPTSVQVQPCLL